MTLVRRMDPLRRITTPATTLAMITAIPARPTTCSALMFPPPSSVPVSPAIGPRFPRYATGLKEPKGSATPDSHTPTSSSCGTRTCRARQAGHPRDKIFSEKISTPIKVHYGDRPVATLIASNPETADDLTSQILVRLLDLAREEREALFATARAWFATGSTTAAARALFCPRNSVNYRLGKLQELTGRSVRHPTEVAELFFVLETVSPKACDVRTARRARRRQVGRATSNRLRQRTLQEAQHRRRHLNPLNGFRAVAAATRNACICLGTNTLAALAM
ncbi:helix-turn-helix domain-containing protein [Streptomyces sp. NPDC048560]|uniref:PucR family transcriptional regulator n=1 Tax=Streptomyces sp. NPDC048560 TaxID=3155488 RepID=UPI003416EDDE